MQVRKTENSWRWIGSTAMGDACSLFKCFAWWFSTLIFYYRSIVACERSVGFHKTNVTLPEQKPIPRSHILYASQMWVFCKKYSNLNKKNIYFSFRLEKRKEIKLEINGNCNAGSPVLWWTIANISFIRFVCRCLFLSRYDIMLVCIMHCTRKHNHPFQSVCIQMKHYSTSKSWLCSDTRQVMCQPYLVVWIYSRLVYFSFGFVRFPVCE